MCTASETTLRVKIKGQNVIVGVPFQDSLLPITLYAGMAELADALDSGSSGGNFVEVQVLLPAPKKRSTDRGFGLLFFRVDKSYGSARAVCKPPRNASQM